MDYNTTNAPVSPINLNIIFMPILIILSSLGTVVNGLVIVTILRVKRLHKTYNVFVLNLAFADIIVTGIYGAFLIHSSYKGGWTLGHTFCVFLAVVVSSSVMVSNICMTFIGLNRYCLIVRGVPTSRRIFTPLNTGLMLLLSWMWGLVFIVPPLVGFGELGYNEGLNACMFVPTDKLSSQGYLVLLAFGIIIPQFVTLYCYVKIFLVVRAARLKVQQETTGQPGGPDKGRRKADIKLTKDLFVMYGVFCFCTIPYAIAQAMDGNQEIIPTYVHSLIGVSMWSNSVWNPMILSLRNKEFKLAMRKSLTLSTIDEQSVSVESRPS
ncbi:melatonin receptor type 1B-B-like [Amphiura filiformis]|uniref:melatonin receptor type 1B-B-like n=1 Tax=Amphiura filiformis TaxID=82378 RepID=UPI003B22527C